MRIANIPPLGADKTVYIVGTGPSLRCTPLDFLKDKTTIGLNQAWKFLPLRYALTVHPDLLVEQKQERPDLSLKWIVKKKKPLASLTLDDERFYVFETSYDPQAVATRPADTLYLGEGAQTTAMDLAARMGAEHIVLVGCDANSLGGDFHGHKQHVRWLGLKPRDQYAAYRQTTAGVRSILRGMGVNVLTLSPFIGINSAEEDYARLKKELNLKPLPKPEDVSPYTRDPRTVRGGPTPPAGVKTFEKRPRKTAELRHTPKPPKRKQG
jgi:hypothetical protein